MSVFTDEQTGVLPAATPAQDVHTRLLRVGIWVLLGVWCLPLYVLFRYFDLTNAIYSSFLGGYLIALLLILGLAGLSIARHERFLRLMHRPGVRIAVFVYPWVQYILYEFFVYQQAPFDLQVVLRFELLLTAFVAFLTIPHPDWRRFSLFLVLVAAGLTFLSPILMITSTAELESRWYAFSSLETNTLDIVFVGNSHGYCSFRPTVIDALLSTSSFSLGVPGSSGVEIYYQVEQMQRTQQPALVVAETLVWRLGESRPHWLRNSTVLRGASYLGLLLSTSPENVDDVLLTPLYFHSEWQRGLETLSNEVDVFWKNVYWNLSAPENYRLVERGWLDNPKIVESDDLLEVGDKVGTVGDSGSSVRKVNLAHFDALLELAEDAGFELWMAEAPTLLSTYRSAAFDTPTRNLITSNGIFFHDYNIDDSVQFARSHFRDFGHLNDFGATVASLRMAEIISEQMDIPINQEAYDQYHAILVEDLLIEVDGDQITYTLDMVEDNSPDVEFSWVVSRWGDTVLAEVPFSAQNFVTFTIPPQGNYTVSMEVRHRENHDVSSSGLLTERYDPAIEHEINEMIESLNHD